MTTRPCGGNQLGQLPATLPDAPGPSLLGTGDDKSTLRGNHSTIASRIASLKWCTSGLSSTDPQPHLISLTQHSF